MQNAAHWRGFPSFHLLSRSVLQPSNLSLQVFLEKVLLVLYYDDARVKRSKPT